VGRLCFGCKYFVDEKIHHRPKVVLSKEGFDTFKRELREFETWLEEVRGREVNYSGTVFSVKPHLTLDPSRNRRLLFHGFLVVFKGGFVDLAQLDDFCYLRLSGRVQEKYQFRRGDQLDFFARFSEKRGRIILTRPNRFEIENREKGFCWNESRARVALRTGTLFEGQPEKCLNCENGCLVDVKGSGQTNVSVHRRLFCLEGVRDPWLCPHVKVKEEIWDECGIHKDAPSEKHRLTTRSNVAADQVV
jgi:hypothetical protein